MSVSESSQLSLKLQYEFTGLVWSHGLSYIESKDRVGICLGAPHFSVLLVPPQEGDKVGTINLKPTWKSHPVGVAYLNSTSSPSYGVVCARDRSVYIFPEEPPSYCQTLNAQKALALTAHDIDPTCVASRGDQLVVGIRHQGGQTGALLIINDAGNLPPIITTTAAKSSLSPRLGRKHKTAKSPESSSTLVVELNFVPLSLHYSDNGQQILVTGAEIVMIYRVDTWTSDARSRAGPPSGWQFRDAVFCSIDGEDAVVILGKFADDGAIMRIKIFQDEDATCFRAQSLDTDAHELLRGRPGVGGLAVRKRDNLFVALEWDDKVKVYQL